MRDPDPTDDPPTADSAPTDDPAPAEEPERPTPDAPDAPGEVGPVMAVRVTADRILCRTEDGSEKRSRGGILIPATAASTDRLGLWAEVRDVGPLVRATETGDKVLFLPDSAVEVDIHGERFLVVRERDVHAIASAERDASGTGLYL